jgi:hypothetical protein
VACTPEYNETQGIAWHNIVSQNVVLYALFLSLYLFYNEFSC